MTATPEPHIEVSFGDPIDHRWVNQELVKQWASQVLLDLEQTGEVDIRLCDETEMSATHSQFAGKHYPTNVLSFPADINPAVGVRLLGDVLICAPVIDREAQEQQKTRQQHLAHMVVHGVLHLLGFDHQHDEQAKTMESQECRLLKQLGFPNPYDTAQP
ncbi:MAG: rRNA maturation RNase YbeY [Lysobacterales bacterium]